MEMDVAVMDIRTKDEGESARTRKRDRARNDILLVYPSTSFVN